MNNHDSRAGGLGPDREAQLLGLLERLDLDRKVRLLSGRDTWTTCAEPAIGLRSMVLSDGPAGVRGAIADERDRSLSLPSGSALGATWSVAAARRYGRVLAAEAKRKNVSVVLGPTINLHRSPFGGRHFEALSEDPHLTARLAAAYVEAVQEHGVGACPKHYVGNEYETERLTASSEIDERTLREVYLAAFEPAVTEAGAWSVMSSYNSVNGTTMTENELLDTPLRSEWGFDGLVMSDWGAVRSVAAAQVSQDLAMPGPATPWNAGLAEAVRSGEVDEALIDAKVVNLLRLAARVGALEGFGTAGASDAPAPTADDRDAYELAVDALVLLENKGRELPWLGEAAPATVAVIGRPAAEPRSQGGGSAQVISERAATPLDGLRRALAEADIDYAPGFGPQPTIAILPIEELTDPQSGEPGVRVVFRDAEGAELLNERRLATSLIWTGNAPADPAELEFETVWTPSADARVELAVGLLGPIELDIDGVRVIDSVIGLPSGMDPVEALLDPPHVEHVLEARAGTPIRLRIATVPPTAMSAAGTARLVVGTAVKAFSERERQSALEDAVALAARSEAAVVVVGTDSTIESEGFDRADLRLPHGQDELVQAVAAVNPRTIVVVNSGSPVLMPWRDQVKAVLLSWFGGQRVGDAVADAIAGDREPGGRLPTTWPAEEADLPLTKTRPLEGRVEYDEGVHVGHRAWQRAGVKPAYAFGYGLGYTDWSIEELESPATAQAGAEVTVQVTVRNTGERRGKYVVQVYAGMEASAVDRPARWLAGFATGELAPGESQRIPITIPARALQHWDTGWRTEPGVYTFHAGFASDALLVHASTAIRPHLES